MKILYAAYEAAPFFQTGGLGEVAKSFAIALSKVNVDVTLILPKYKPLNIPKQPQNIGSFTLEFASKIEKVKILSLPIQTRITLYLVDNPLLSQAAQKKSKPENFIFFSKAVAKMISLRKDKVYGKFDLIHLNDWQVSLVAYFLKQFGKGAAAPTILTIHNLMYQGPLQMQKLTDLTGIVIKDEHLSTVLATALPYPDFITVVSPTYAKEIVNTKRGVNLRKILYARRDTIKGILNGIDNHVWDPQHDKSIPFNFSGENVDEGKNNNKISLQRDLELPIFQPIPVVSFIGRLEPNQKGIDIIYKAMPDLLKEDEFQFVLLGTGNEFWAKKIGELVKKFPKRFVFINKFDEKLSHKIYASSDIIVIPSKYEPCGLVQMIAMRYATLPLVRKTGGLADTVSDGVNGFVFERYSPTEFARTLRLALKLFKENPEKIAKMRENAMQEDFSWSKSAREYKKLYQKIIREKKRAML